MLISGDDMRRRGFTLIEVIAVILLIGLLTVFLVPTIVNQMGNKQNEINSITEDIMSLEDAFLRKTGGNVID